MNSLWVKVLRRAPHFLGIILASPALAQSVDLPLPPKHNTTDENSVNLVTGKLAISDRQISIGTDANGITHERYWPGAAGWRHNHMISAFADSANHVTLSIGGSSVGFSKSEATWSADNLDGSTLVESATSYSYTDRDGNSIYFDRTIVPVTASYYGGVTAIATTVTSTTGQKEYLVYRSAEYEFDIAPWIGASEPVFVKFTALRLQSVRTSTGYQLKYTYATDTASDTSIDDWVRITNVRAINTAVDYCDPAADSCSGFTQNWASVSYSKSISGSDTIEAVTDPEGRTRRYITSSGGKLTGIRRPSSPGSDNVTYSYDGNGRVSSAAVAGVGTWSYAFTLSGSTMTGSITTPTIPSPKVITINTIIEQPTSITDENGLTTQFVYHWGGRLEKLTQPEGNYWSYYYDNRSNVTSTVVTPKPGSGLGTLTTFASYPAGCINAATCNKPTTTTDVAGNVTNYYYNNDGTLDYV